MSDRIGKVILATLLPLLGGGLWCALPSALAETPTLTPDAERTALLATSSTSEGNVSRGSSSIAQLVQDPCRRACMPDEVRDENNCCVASPAELLQPLAGCPPGQSITPDTLGHCCWGGQAWNGRSCVGVPAECPDGYNNSGSTCELSACEDGRERMADGIHCCWPDQGWSVTNNCCVGRPATCPTGLQVSDTGCVSSVATRGWYGFDNSPNKDRESELLSLVSDFARVFVAEGTSFDDLCRSLGLECTHVVDWQGVEQSCRAAPLTAGDGSRIAFCELP